MAAPEKVAVRIKVKKKMEAPGSLVASKVGTSLAVSPKFPRALIKPEARVTIRKP